MLIRVGKLQLTRPPIRQINCSLPTRINIDLKKFLTF